MPKELAREVKETALRAGADLVGIGSIDRYDASPDSVHPKTIFAGTRSIIAVALRMVRGALKTIEDGTYWQAYNCDSYQYLNEILAPRILREIVRFLEDRGYTSVPVHNPFHSRSGRPVRKGGSRPDGIISLRTIGVVTGLGELGMSKLLLTPQFGPRQRVYGIFTDAELAPDPLIEKSVCDDCGACVRSCPAGAIGSERTVKVKIGNREFSHAPLDESKCIRIHAGEDARYSPFVTKETGPDNPPDYYQFLRKRFQHLSICGGRGCVRACMDHLEKTGRIEKRYRTPMIEGEQWVLEDL